jgi:hypothetical protein
MVVTGTVNGAMETHSAKTVTFAKNGSVKDKRRQKESKVKSNHKLDAEMKPSTSKEITKNNVSLNIKLAEPETRHVENGSADLEQEVRDTFNELLRDGVTRQYVEESRIFQVITKYIVRYSFHIV